MTKLEMENGGRTLLHLDAGGMADYYVNGGGNRTKTLVASYEAMGVAAVNVTPRELGYRAEEFLGVKAESKLRFLSSNIIDLATNEPVFEPSIQLESNGQRIGIVGITDKVPKEWELPGGRRIGTTEPMQTAKESLAKLRHSCDLLIVLAHVPIWKIREFARVVSEADVILGSDGHTITPKPVQVGETTISYAGRQGEYIGHLKLRRASNGRWELAMYNLRRLSREMPEDSEVKEIVEKAEKKAEKE